MSRWLKVRNDPSSTILDHLEACNGGDDADDSLSRYLRFDDPNPLSCLLTLLPPFFIQNGIELKSFIRSETFREIRRRYGDRRAVDAIFVRAMQLTSNNTGIALFLATVATFDHRIVGLKVPVFALFFPLSNESAEEFDERVRNLPSKLYGDSPSGEHGDRDKLQHFFGSAFFTFVFESRQPSQRIGEFIEEGEDAFIVDGALDDRDARANLHGQEFGLALLENNRRLPSEFLLAPIATNADSIPERNHLLDQSNHRSSNPDSPLAEVQLPRRRVSDNLPERPSSMSTSFGRAGITVGQRGTRSSTVGLSKITCGRVKLFHWKQTEEIEGRIVPSIRETTSTHCSGLW